MENPDIEYVARYFATLSGIPTRVADSGRLIHKFFPVALPRDPALLYREENSRITAPIGYFITPNLHAYGVVNAGTVRIVMGPTAQVLADDHSLRELAFKLDVPRDEAQDFVEAMKSITRVPLETLLRMLCPICYILTGEKLELKDISISGDEQKAIKSRVEKRRTEQKYELEFESPNNTLQIEEQLTRIVRKGDTTALTQWIRSIPSVNSGIMADSHIRQIKNTFIVTATLVSRAAIRGGMDAGDAFTLSDVYIRRAELLTRPDQVTNLQFNMILEFTEQVEKLRYGKSPSKLQLDVANYIQRHLSEPISTEEMAKEFFLTRTHFSAKFKAETGMTLTDFILSEKTEEAKRLLRYSDKSVAAIGEYLGFSSHGHFSKVFKKYSGDTPQEYRDKHT